MHKRNQKLTKKEKLQQENNLLKAKLMAENGASFFEEDIKMLTLEMENDWLNYIYNFEHLHKDAKKIQVYEKIGKPVIRPSDTLEDHELSKELDILLNLMGENGIELTCLAEYHHRIIYEFITKELFEHDIEDVKIEGLVNCFTYEDFHPNHDYDLRRQTEDFLEALLSRGWHEMDGTFVHDELIDTQGKTISKEEFFRIIKSFQDSYQSFNIKAKEITHSRFDFERGEAFTKMELSYVAITETGEKINFSGKADLFFTLDYGYWNINKVTVPGFN